MRKREELQRKEEQKGEDVVCAVFQNVEGVSVLVRHGWSNLIPLLMGVLASP